MSSWGLVSSSVTCSRHALQVLDPRHILHSRFAQCRFRHFRGQITASSTDFTAHTLDLSTLVSVPISSSFSIGNGRSVVYIDARNDHPLLLGSFTGGS